MGFMKKIEVGNHAQILRAILNYNNFALARAQGRTEEETL